ncbi:protein-ADP-ribose hydrolase [Nocardioides xinjiangensis]|uniref:protein-ADP-ribose hydrolase n=1 Tax=Nocardioides xinjiangensis TaxID=2817376 RepID=UPI001B30DF85|nr:protein-ADP-ribose hydrolase [Nocardioides sp. SYSU D00514]
MSVTELTQRQVDRAVVDLLDHLAPEAAAETVGATARQRRVALADVLTVRPPGPLPDGLARLLDGVLAWENAQRLVTDTADLPRLRLAGVGSRMSLWQGDITALRADAIVNAANNRMLGCFAPGHACIDNAIHAVAGPRLREECAAHMAAQCHLEPTGAATLTGGYHLPARHVLHTVGPIVADGEPSAADAEALASCYRSCLDTADSHGDIASVAFCSISTGVFAYPIEAATVVAVDTVTRWLTAHPESEMQVIFNTFSDHDTAVYRTTLEGRLP